jgi:hypothetical protein
MNQAELNIEMHRNTAIMLILYVKVNLENEANLDSFVKTTMAPQSFSVPDSITVNGEMKKSVFISYCGRSIKIDSDSGLIKQSSELIFTSDAKFVSIGISETKEGRKISVFEFETNDLQLWKVAGYQLMKALIGSKFDFIKII